jgi:hypothetical protein
MPRRRSKNLDVSASFVGREDCGAELSFDILERREDIAECAIEKTCR